MRAISLLLPLGLALAACDTGPSVEAENASVAEVADKLRAAGGAGEFVSPGKWLSNVTVEEMSLPGMPPEMAAGMKEAMGKAGTKGAETCLTAEDVKKPKEDFFAGADKSCRYDRFTMSGGKIDAAMRCSQGGASQVMTMAGTYGPDAYGMKMTTKAEGGSGPMAAMTMTMRVDAKRIGQCDGSETNKG